MAMAYSSRMHLTTETAQWENYQLLDSGDGKKLERFGEVTVVRPEFQALWAPEQPALWSGAHAEYVQDGEDGRWETHGNVPDSWTVRYHDLVFSLRRASFKHTGLFPEQAANWDVIQKTVKKGATTLNLFGYTGGATLAGLRAGAEVVHVDASKPAIASAKKNAELSGLHDRTVRWIVDDAMTFVEREVRRARRYNLVIMDPPAFGRGPKREIWRFEDHLTPLLALCKDLLRPKGVLMVNAYSMGFSARVVEQTVGI